MDLTIDYNERMLNRYPEVIKSIREFQTLIAVQSSEVDWAHGELDWIFQNAYIDSADEYKISQWEDLLGITPLEQGDDDYETWLSDRKETILARLYNVEKLNEKAISDIVKIFTGGEAKSYFKDGIIHVIVLPPKDNKRFKFENVEQALANKIPAHLSFRVSRNYYDWSKMESSYNTWGDLNDSFTTWEEVLYQFNANETSTLSAR